MVYRRLEQHRRRAVWIVVGKVHAELEDEIGVGRVCGAVDGSRPHGHVLVVGESGYARRRLGHYVHEFFLQAAQSLARV